MSANFGQTIRETVAAFGAADSVAGRSVGRPTKSDVVVRMIVTLAVLALGSYLMIIPDADAQAKQFGAGFIGAVTGYWLK